MKITLKRLSLAFASVGMLTIYGCGGGGSSTEMVTSTGIAPPASITVVPSLGQFSTGTPVSVSKLDGSLIKSGAIGADGKVTLTLDGYTGAVVVQVTGGNTSAGAPFQYWDEGTVQLQDFGTGKVLRAVVPVVTTAPVGVTALTHAAAEKLIGIDGKFTNATTASINDANAKVATALGLLNASILDAPTLVNSTTSRTLDEANPGDKYALVLAALTTSTTTALDVATALAADLKDNNFDGKEATTAIPAAYTPTTLVANYKSIAGTLATPTSATTIANAPIALATTTNVSSVTADTTSPVNQAKAMFAELRTTLKSFANDNKTAFLDTQSTRINADLNANVEPEFNTVKDRVTALDRTLTAFENAKAYPTAAYPSGDFRNFAPTTTPLSPSPQHGPALVSLTGDFQGAVYGYASADYCWTETIAATTATGTVTCAHTGKNSATWTGFNSGYLRMTVFALTGITNNQYSYTATRYHMAFSTSAGVIATGAISLASGVPSGSGTVSKTVSGTTTTSLTLSGTLPPSATDATGMNYITGVDTVAYSVVRTALAGNNYHYALTGSASTTKFQAAALPITSIADRTETLTFSNGSYFDVDETNAATGKNKAVAAKLILSAKTAATQFTGTLDMSAFALDADLQNESPTSMTFTGSMSDIRPSIGTGEILTGKLEATTSNFSSYHSNQANSASNFIMGTVAFTGTVQATWRPLLKLVVAVNKNAYATSNVSLNYSYGAVKISGSGTINSQNTASNTLTLSNQDGIQLAITSAAPTTVGATATPATTEVTKSGTHLATISNGSISYIDGVTESLN